AHPFDTSQELTMSVQPAIGVRRHPPTQEAPTSVLPKVQATMLPSAKTMDIPASRSPRDPFLTVWSESAQRGFAPSQDVMIGRDPQADIHVGSPLVSRIHLILRYGNGQWIATDNGSLNGIFVDGRQVSSVTISDGQSINIGDPDGPPLTFGVGR